MRTRPAFYYFGNVVLRVFFRLLFRIDLRGLERVPAEGPLIVAISHSSFLDPMLVGPFIRRDVTPMAKAESFHWPIIGAIVRWYGAIPVRRGEADLSAFKKALKLLAGGGVLVIAPEGHRSETGALQRGREGAIILSLRTGAPILPVAVWGGKAFWSNLAHVRRTVMHFYVGEPVLPVFLNGKPTRERVSEMSDDLMLRIAGLMPAEIRGYYQGRSATGSQTLRVFEPGESGLKEREVVEANSTQ
jgi:1-acyl-sn-glycerol-3-phosphate acyltransferase